MSKNEDNSAVKEPLNSEVERRPSTTSTILPAYHPTDEPPREGPPPYEQATTKSPLPKTSTQPAKSQDAKPSTSGGPQGSCGMPASMVMGVMGGPSASKSKDSGKKASKPEPMPGGPSSAQTSSRWNVQGVKLSDFGSFKGKK